MVPVFVFAYGVVGPLVLPRDIYPEELVTIFSDKPQWAGLVTLLCAIGTAAAVFIWVRVESRKMKKVRFATEMFIYSILAFAIGTVVSVAVGCFGGIDKTICDSVFLYGFFAITNLSGGIAGIVAMRSCRGCS